jgi:hypothetical protein
VPGRRAYHQRVVLNPLYLAIGLVLALVGLYAVCVWALAFFLAIRPLAARFLIPILIIAWVAPFIAAPERVTTLVRRIRGPRDEPPRPIKNVTPPDDPAPPG